MPRAPGAVTITTSGVRASNRLLPHNRGRESPAFLIFIKG
jgi:hypothetical protein